MTLELLQNMPEPVLREMQDVFRPGLTGEPPAFATPMRLRRKMAARAAYAKPRIYPLERRQWLELAAACTAVVANHARLVRGHRGTQSLGKRHYSALKKSGAAAGDIISTGDALFFVFKPILGTWNGGAHDT